MKSRSIIDLLHWILGMFFNFAIVVAVGIAVYFITIRGFEFGETLAADFTAVGDNYEFPFVLDHDTPASEVARELEYMGIISNRFLFNLELFLMGGVRTYEAGTYTLNRNMSYREIRRTLGGGVAQGQAQEEEIRIPEGWTIKDMADYFEYRGFFTAEEFINVATYGHFSFSFLMNLPTNRPNGLEGYLFPDTYRIPANPNPGDIISRMLRQFDRVFDAELRDQAYEMGLTIDEVIIMASIIERETRLASERPMVSGVIHNRLAIDMNLEMCSTVAYVLDVPRDRLLLADLQIDSPFNTYMHSGLPIGPISNPGEAAIRAALNPDDHNYLFFVLYDFETGEHFFARTWEEHDAADQRARARQ